MDNAFSRFCQAFNAAPGLHGGIEHPILERFTRSPGAAEFLSRFGGQTLRRGVYRVHRVDDIEKWTASIASMFPEYARRIVCFSYDWLGRHFALDFGRVSGNEPLMLMLDPGAGQVFQIPATFSSFHEEELVNYMDDSLAVPFFDQWRQQHDEAISTDHCVGYRVPLFLGGSDTVDNLELSDMEVYWEICGQLWNKVRDLPEGTVIGEIAIEKHTTKPPSHAEKGVSD